MKMEIIIAKAKKSDKDFILKANKEINILSGINDSGLVNHIDHDLFCKNSIANCLVAKDEKTTVGMCIYSYVYWANLGYGIYLSQVYVDSNYRKKGIMKKLLNEIYIIEKNSKFVTALVGPENEGMRKALDLIGFKTSELVTYYKTTD